MIKSISLERFKAFSKLDDLEIKPLTILCGVNSGGKSSILKSLLLLKQSYENVASNNEATLNGVYTTNGLMKDLIHMQRGDSFSIRNVFHVKYKGKKFVRNSKQDISTAKELGKITGFRPDRVSAFIIDVTCTIKRRDRAELWDTNFIEKYIVVVKSIAATGAELPEEEFQIELDYRRAGKYDISITNLPSISGKHITCELKNCTCYFSGMRLTNLYYENQLNEKTIVLNDFLTNIYAIFRIVADQYSGLQYLGPLRENPKRQYMISNEYISTNSTGADTPFILAKHQTKKVIAELYPPYSENEFDKKVAPTQSTLLELVQQWMSYFELGDLEIKNQQGSLQLNIQNSNIADVGFGISQTLPVIVHGLSMDYEQTLILEQPEIHLHPRMQMRMSDFLLTLSQTNHCVIVETHSDHIINRLVRRALEAKDDMLLRNIAIYFVENTGEGSQVHEIEIDRIRGISESPSEFFTQFASETSYIVKAGINNIHGGD